VARRSRGRLEVLTTALADGRRVLPVFSSEEEAALYLRNAIRGSWQLRPTRAGELVSVLCSLCSTIDLAALDPISDVENDDVNALVSLGRERFVDVLLRREAFAEKAPAPLSPSSSALPWLADGGRGVCARTTGAWKKTLHQVGAASVS
jgi:hypothetical protein